MTPGKDLIIAESFDNSIENDVTDTYNIFPSVTKYNKNGLYHVLLRNDSAHHMTFATNTHIAEMQHISRQNCFLQLEPLKGVMAIPDICEEDEFYNILLQKENITHDQLIAKLYKMEKAKPTPMEHSEIVNDFDEAKAYCQDKSTNLYRKIKQNIDQSSYMNEEEKKQAMEQFVENGYYTQPASEVIDHNRKTNELKHNTEIITHEEYVKRVDLSHLSLDHQVLSKGMLERCKKAFACFEWDIPVAKGFILDPIVKEGYKNLTLNTKYVPTEQQNREELDQVIDTMVKNDILVRADEPTPVINNIMTTLKASGKKGYLLDSRAVNLVTRRAQVALIPKTRHFSAYWHC